MVRDIGSISPSSKWRLSRTGARGCQVDDSIAEGLGALTRFIVGEARFDETLERVAMLAERAIEPASMAGITMMVRGQAATAFFTDDEVPEIDQAQYEAGDGPCLESFRTGQCV